MNETDIAIEAQALRLRAVIKDFLQARLQPKLEEIKKREDKLPEGDHEEQRKLELDRQQRVDAYDLETWIADAAKRAGQIQQATHALKFTHPDARGSSLNTPGHPQAGDLTVGTHTLGHDYKPDVVGNAAQLDVYKFLCLEADGETLLNRVIRSDPAPVSGFVGRCRTGRILDKVLGRHNQGQGRPGHPPIGQATILATG